MLLSLLLLKAWILFIDYIQSPFSPHDLAVGTAFFNGSSNLHFRKFNFLFNGPQLVKPIFICIGK